jgi:hypothetical protein
MRNLSMRIKHASQRSESGIAVTWLVIMLPVICGFAAMAIDVAYYAQRGMQAQRAADAAALGGVVFLPNDVTGGLGEADRLLEKNGFNGTSTIEEGAKANQLQVTVKEEVPSFFARVLGKESFHLERRALAEYMQPLGMGSPSATLGNDPTSAAPQPNFWLSQFGPAARKHDGDRYGADNCVDDPSDTNSSVYRCAVVSATRGSNTEYANAGYKFGVNVQSVVPGKDLYVEVFDPVLANVGSRCTNPVFPDAGQISALDSMIGDASTRYLDGNNPAGLAWCTGDHSGGYWPDGYTGVTPTTMQFDVYAPTGAVLIGVAPVNPIPTPPPAEVIPGPTGGVAAPCGAVASAGHDLKITNNRITALRPVQVTGACFQVAEPDIAPGATVTIAAGDLTRWRIFDIGDPLVAGDDELVEDFVLPVPTPVVVPGPGPLPGPAVPVVGLTERTYEQPVATGPIVPPPCSGEPLVARELKIDNQRTDDLILQFIDETCELTTVHTIPAGTAYIHNGFDGQRYQIRTTSSNLLDDFVLSDAQALRQHSDPTGGGTATSSPVCSRRFQSFTLSAYNPAKPNSGTIFQLVNHYDGVHDDGAGTRDVMADQFASSFRRWVTVCRIPAVQVSRGTYTVRVRTDVEEPVGGTGKNGYSIRAAWVDGAGVRADTGLSVSALERLPVYINLGGVTSSELYMTRVTPEYSGKWLRVELFDIGDTAAGTVNLTLKSPADATGSPWICTISKVSSDAVTAAGNGCSIDGLTRTEFNGSVVRIRVDIPPDYSCDRTVPANCWVKMEMSFNGGAAPTDQTTWSAAIEGDPIRLVK